MTETECHFSFSAGVGRSGAYIVIHSMVKRMHVTGDVNVFDFLSEIRQQRNLLVQEEVSGSSNSSKFRNSEKQSSGPRTVFFSRISNEFSHSCNSLDVSYAPFIWRKVVPGRRVTRLPELPWASQLFLHFLTKLGEPFTWETKSWLGWKGDPPSRVTLFRW